jgi:hypothetical protein
VDPWPHTQAGKPITVPAAICGLHGLALIDTGSSITAVDECVFRVLVDEGLNDTLEPWMGEPPCGISGEALHIVGVASLPLTLGQCTNTVWFIVVSGVATPVIIGNDTLQLFSTLMVDFVVGTVMLGNTVPFLISH